VTKKSADLDAVFSLPFFRSQPPEIFWQGVLTMSSLALLQSLKESILAEANVKAIYGEPVSAQGKTVIPVAKIMYGYGGGAGTGGVGDTSAKGEGGGGEWERGPFPWAPSKSAISTLALFRSLTTSDWAGLCWWGGLGIWLGFRRRGG
jgi:hypothetical protein